MAPPLLTLQNIHLTFGGTPLLTGADMMIGPGERLCLVGRNGSGKSTFLKIAAGFIEPDEGERFVQPGTTVAYLPQEPDFTGHRTALDYVAGGLAPTDDPHAALLMLLQLGLTGEEDVTSLSGGEKRRVALARVLAPQPDILLLDEPTNHLDLPAILWLEEWLKAARSALVLISHDRRFLETLSEATLWIDRGRTRLMARSFRHFEEWRDTLLEEEATTAQKLGRKIAMEEDWLRYGVTARRKRNVKRLGDLHALKAQREEKKGDQARARARVQMQAAQADISGKLVAEARNISKSYGGRPVVTDFSVRIQRGERIGIVGANGAGKTTLVKLLTGRMQPDTGYVRQGMNLEMLYLDQSRDALEPHITLKYALADGSDMVHLPDGQKHVISYMKDFLFLPEQAGTPIGDLSGGERGRLMLARSLRLASNVMVLDEPTNDLDLETLDLLQEMLADYKGTILLVSHDRDFLDRIVDSVIFAEGEGEWVRYAGGYSDMAVQRREREKPAESLPRKARPKTAAKPVTEARGKLSFKHKHALETLPKTMARLETTIAAHKKTLEDASLYTSDPERFQKTVDALARAEADLAAAEEEWLELEMLREEVEGP